MRILYLVDTYPTYDNTTPNIFVHNQVKNVKKQGIDVAVCWLDLSSIRNKRKWGFSNYEYENVPVYRISLPIGPIHLILRPAYKSVALWGMQKIQKEWGKPDIIHAHFYMMVICAEQIKRYFSVPYVVTEHSSKVLKEDLTFSERKDVEKAYNQAEYVWAVSEALKEKMSKLTSNEIKVLANIIPSEFHYMKSISKYEKYTFICVGNLCKIKRMDLLIDAMKQLKKELDANLIIVGKGEEESSLKTKVKDYNLEQCIKFMGSIENHRLPELYNKCHCFVLTSDYETFGVVWREALSCGIPVIGTACGGPEEIIDKSNGCIIPTNDVDSLVKAMKWMYFNPHTFSPEELSYKVKEQCSVTIIVRELIAQYKKCLDKIGEIQ